MNQIAEISFYLDQRRPKEKGVYPLKLYVYINRENRRYYPLNIDMTRETFERSYLAEKPRGKFKELKLELEAIVTRANDMVKELGKAFTFDRFKQKMFPEKIRFSRKNDVVSYYHAYREELTEQDRITTEDSYRLSIQSILAFVNKDRKRKVNHLPFEVITPQFLHRYEKWMLESGKTETTVGIYLRPLRHIFNIAISDKCIPRDIYPFTSDQYTIPAGGNIKKALDKDALRTLYTANVPEGSPIEKARDYWFFCYQCNGLNFKDIAELKYKNVTGSSFWFIRHKVKRTTKKKPKPIIVPLTDRIRAFMEKYGNPRTSDEDYVFPIFSSGMDAREKLRTLRNFIRFVNQHMAKLAKQAGISGKTSTNVARHSFTTSSIRNGVSMEFIQESLGHQTLATTQNYWAGFEEKVKREIAEALMDF